MQIATFTRINQEILQYIAIRNWLYVPFLDTQQCAAQPNRNCNETDLLLECASDDLLVVRCMALKYAT